MSWWYYAGPDAKPNGPVSLEELRARHGQGVILPDTYVIEHAGAAGVVGNWRHYREVFPDQAILPPVPGAVPPVLPTQNPPPIHITSPSPYASHSADVLAAKQRATMAATVSGAHPLFPSAGAVTTAPQPHPVPPAYPSNIAPHAAPHGNYPSYPTNAACAWGFGLGLAGFVMSLACGSGMLLAIPSLILSVLGLVQVQYRRNQSGAGLAIAGVVLAILGLIISTVMIAYLWPYIDKAVQDQMASQQNSD